MSDAKAKGWEGHVTRKALSEFQRCELQSFGIHRHAYARTIPVTVLPRETAAALLECAEFMRQPVPAYHGHFDRKGQSGAGDGCPACNAFREWRRERDAVLARLDAAGGAE